MDRKSAKRSNHSSGHHRLQLRLMAAKFVSIGKILKAHGVHGALRVALNESHEKTILEMPPLFIGEVQPIPYFIQNISEGPGYWILTLDDVNSRESAGKLNGLEICVKDKDAVTVETDDDEGLAVLIGYAIIEEEVGVVGEICDVVSLPQQELAVVKSDDREYLIPLTEAFITGIDPSEKTIYMQLPQGLLEL